MSLTIKKTKHGLGLFATRPFKKDEFIIEYFGRKISTDEADSSESRYLFTLTARHAIDGADRANIARYINHSCRPNVIAMGKQRLWIHATRRIKAGEELTLDYGPDYLNYFIPACGCPVCNGRPPRSGKKAERITNRAKAGGKAKAGNKPKTETRPRAENKPGRA